MKTIIKIAGIIVAIIAAIVVNVMLPISQATILFTAAVTAAIMVFGLTLDDEDLDVYLLEEEDR